MIKRITALIVITLIVLIASTINVVGGTHGGKINVFVSISPQAYFVNRIGGPHVETTVLVPPGRDMHTFEPTPRMMADLAKARLFFTLGIPFEKTFMRKAGSTFRNLEIIDSSRGIKRRMMSEEESEPHEHGHGEDGHKNHGGEPDPHIWLDPVRAKTIATNIFQGLAHLDPRGREKYKRNLDALQKDLDKLNTGISQRLAPYKGKDVFVFHPAFGYFTDRYGLRQVPVEVGGKQPTARQLARLIDRAKSAGVKVIFVQPQFSERSADAVASAIGGVVVRVDPLAYAYLKNLKDMADKMAKALGRSEN